MRCLARKTVTPPWSCSTNIRVRARRPTAVALDCFTSRFCCRTGHPSAASCGTSRRSARHRAPPTIWRAKSLYLQDPDNLGIEGDAHCPRTAWRRVGRRW